MPESAHSANDMKAEFQTNSKPEPDNKANGELIRELLTNADMTQKELAEELGIHPSYLSDLLKGNRGFSEGMFYQATDAIAKYQKKAK